HPAATVRTGARVVRLQQAGGRIAAAILDSGEVVEADHFVVANGLQGYELLKRHGENVPLYGLKGYSLTIPLAQTNADDSTAAQPAPPISVTDYERRTVNPRLENRVRITAKMAMGDGNAGIGPNAI